MHTLLAETVAVRWFAVNEHNSVSQSDYFEKFGQSLASKRDKCVHLHMPVQISMLVLAIAHLSRRRTHYRSSDMRLGAPLVNYIIYHINIYRIPICPLRRLMKYCQEAGLQPIVPDGGSFVCFRM